MLRAMAFGHCFFYLQDLKFSYFSGDKLTEGCYNLTQYVR